MNQLGKFNGVLLVSDFDDTLYGEDMRITRENVEALTYFTREGGTFTVATGRARPNCAPHASHIPINAPVILSNGSALYDFRTGEMIYETFLPDRVREDLQQMARAIPTIGFEAYHHDAIYVYQPNAVTQRHLERAGMTAREVPIADIPLPWSKVILQQDYETLLHTQRYLLERWGEHYEVIFSNRVLLELTRKGSSKGGMVQYLARRLGIDAQQLRPRGQAVGRPYPGRLRGELRGADCGYPGSYLRVNMCAARRNSGGRRVLSCLYPVVLRGRPPV